RPAGQDAVRARERSRKRVLPERRLADAGIALKQEGHGPERRRVEEPLDLLNFRLASEKSLSLDQLSASAGPHHRTYQDACADSQFYAQLTRRATGIARCVRLQDRSVVMLTTPKWA